MRSDNLHIPPWVRQALSNASNSGLIDLPRTGWNQFTMSSFFRTEKRCWFISDTYRFETGTMVCEPDCSMLKDDPIVIEQCDFLSKVLHCRYEITQIGDSVRVELSPGSRGN